MTSWMESVRQGMARSGKSFYQLCREKGSAGGRKAAANKRRRALLLSGAAAEKLRQVGRGMESPDAVPDARLTRQDQVNMSRDGQSARLRMRALEARP